MSPSSARRWRRTFILIGVLLCLSGALLYGLERLSRDAYRLWQQAAELYAAQRYHEAITAYAHLLQHAPAPALRLSDRLLGRDISTASIQLQIANSHYRLAEAELRRYQEAIREARSTPPPPLETVQHLLTVTLQAYDQVPQSDARTYTAAQVNAARVATWQLILAAVAEQASGRRALKHQAIQTVQRTAKAVDLSHQYATSLSRQEHMTALLLLETLTAFSQERPPPRPPLPADTTASLHLGDLLWRDDPELSPRERERFRQFFFAMPLEAHTPWPPAPQEGAGTGRRPAAH